jgi:hypothetical protein
MLDPGTYAQTLTEHAQQTALFMWAAQHKDDYPELTLMFAIPNGGLRNMATAARLKAEGVKAGVPDIFLPVARLRRNSHTGETTRWYYHGLFIEMKKPRVGKQKADKRSDAQLLTQYALEENHYHCVVCYGYNEARDNLLSYLALPKFNYNV